MTSSCRPWPGRAATYAAAEAANASPLQTLEQDVLGVINTPTELLVGRPLIGNGTNGAAGTGQNGGAGGILWGNGGNGGSGRLGRPVAVASPTPSPAALAATADSNRGGQ